jgi:cytochrome b involved in lipid metabolism
MIITNKLIANVVFSIVLAGSAGMSGLAAKELVHSYPEVKSIFAKDSQKISEVVSQNKEKGTTTDDKAKDLRCLISVNGKTYNVTQLKNTHSGGDIFKCGSDMTLSFNSMHSNNYSLIEKYVVTDAVVPTQTQTSTPSKSNTGILATEVAKHNTASSCWVTYSGKVYDVTGNASWNSCIHHGVKGGTDITKSFPHSTTYFNTLKVVGMISTSNSGTGSNSGASNNGTATTGTITSAQLATHNTSTSCWVAYSGKVYDVTGNVNWNGCSHHGANGGTDITKSFPHSTTYFNTLKVVGTIGTTSGNSNGTNNNSNDNDDNDDDRDERENENEREDEDEWEFEFED